MIIEQHSNTFGKINFLGNSSGKTHKRKTCHRDSLLVRLIGKIMCYNNKNISASNTQYLYIKMCQQSRQIFVSILQCKMCQMVVCHVEPNIVNIATNYSSKTMTNIYYMVQFPNVCICHRKVPWKSSQTMAKWLPLFVCTYIVVWLSLNVASPSCRSCTKCIKC